MEFPSYVEQYISDDGLMVNLFRATMSRDWKEVLDLFQNNKQIQYVKITRDGDTVLHVAVSVETENIILSLLQTIENTNTEEVELDKILRAQNKDGDTPLHLAAALGQNRVCHKIAQLRPQMVTEARNKYGETPVFTAVRHGKKHTFFVLEAAIQKQNKQGIDRDWLFERDVSHCRRNDGDNILHHAISGEHFDLAYEIIQLYPKLVNHINAHGESALHILARMPSVFKSGTRFGFYDRIIYDYTITEPLKLKFHDFVENQEHHLSHDCEVLPETNKASISLPETYKTCIYLFSSTKYLINYIFKTVASNLRAGTCGRSTDDDPEKHSVSQKGDDENETSETQKQIRWIPHNYDVAVSFLKSIVQLLFLALGLVLKRQQTIGKHKQKHSDTMTIMKKLVDQSRLWEYGGAGGALPMLTEKVLSRLDLPSIEETQQSTSKECRDILKEISEKMDIISKEIKENKSKEGPKKKEVTEEPDIASPVLVAARTGITEMVERILTKFPMAILDQDRDEKNIVLLVAEHRQLHIYNRMLNVQTMKEMLFGKVDKNGNSALHLAALLTRSRSWSWSMHGAALQMQFDSNWYKYVLKSGPQELLAKINRDGKTAQDVFIENHQTLMNDGSSWLINITQSCTVVATLVATVAFTSANQVPGGVTQDHGSPVLANKLAFQVFAISSLAALCFSVTSLVLFLAILTSHYQTSQFERELPVKLILGLTTLFISIASMLVSFCAGNLLIFGEKLKFVVYPIYAVMSLPVIYFAISTYPIYVLMMFPFDF